MLYFAVYYFMILFNALPYPMTPSYICNGVDLKFEILKNFDKMFQYKKMFPAGIGLKIFRQQYSTSLNDN
jgi:hypothetical protein